MLNRPGIRPQFPKIKTYLKNYVLGIDDWQERDLPRLVRYAKEGSFDYCDLPEYGAQTFNFFDSHRSLLRVANSLRWYAIQGALSGNGDWLSVWMHSMAYAYWSSRMHIRTQRRVLDDYRSGKRPQYLPLLCLAESVFVLANCLALGWKDLALDLGHRCLWALDENGFSDGHDTMHRRTHHFVLRLIGNEQGWPERTSPACAFDEPVFNVLVENWRTPEPSDLALPLLAACDRHTHEARFWSNKANYDFESEDQWYVPFEVLTVLKLRDLHGLPNPELDHPLMNTPLGKLPPPQPIYTDDLLEGVLARARQEYFDF